MLFFRTLGVGLIASAAVMAFFMPDFIDWFVNSTAYSRFMSFHAFSEAVSQVIGSGIYAPVLYTLISCGVGFFAAGLLYPPIESAFLAMSEAAGRVAGEAPGRIMSAHSLPQNNVRTP